MENLLAQNNLLLLDNISDPLVVLNQEDTIVFANEKFKKIFTSEIDSKNVWEAFPYLKDSIFYIYINKIAKTNKTISFDFQLSNNKRFLVNTFFQDSCLYILFKKNKTKQAFSESVDTDIRLRLIDGVINNLIDLIFVFNRNLNCVFVNKAAAQEINKPVGSVLGKNLQQLSFPSEYSMQMKEQLISVFKNGNIVKGEMQTSLSTKYKTFDYVLLPVYDNNKKVMQVISISRDVSHRKRMEDKLSNANKQLGIILQNISEGLNVYNSDQVLLFTNKLSAELTGYSSVEEMIQTKNLKEIIKNRFDKYELKDEKGNNITAEMLPAIKTLAGNKKEEAITKYINKKTGEEKWILLKSNSVLNDKDRLEMIVNLYIDITKQKQTENELRYARNQLDAIINNIVDGVSVYDNKGKLLFANNTFWEIGGIKSKKEKLEIKNIKQTYKALTDRFEITDEAGNPFNFKSAPTNKTLKGETYSETTMHLRHKIYKKEIWLLAKSRQVLNSDGRVIMVVNVLDNITEHKNLENRKDEFISIISHELKTPLTSIKAFGQVLQRKLERSGNKEMIESFQKMNSQIDRFVSLVLELMDASSIKTGRLPVDKEVFNINDLVNQVVWEIQTSVKDHKIIIKNSVDAMILADKNRLSQAITNLIANAIRYSSAGSPINVFLELSPDKNNIIFGVQDFGIGISKENQKKIFYKFYQVRDSLPNHDPSLGLGLYISSQIISNHGGRIWLKSKEGAGSTFYFQVPLYR